ncbi:NAD(P)-binding protein [Boletus edulis]|nr:NAD(P)-binding protein [Boletus edulis]
MLDSLTVWQAYSLMSAPIICCAGSTVADYAWYNPSLWYTVFASCRSPSTATDLESLTSSSPGKLHVVKLDMTDQEIPISRRTLRLRLILNILAMSIMPNVMGPALVSRYFLPAIERSDRKVIVNMTGTLASIGRDCGPGSTSYIISKTALNTYKQVKVRGDFVALLIDSRWVKTQMGGPGATLEPRMSVRKMLNAITKATAVDARKFYKIPW